MENLKQLLENKIREMVSEAKDELGDIITTIPVSIDWNTYQKEIDLVKDYSNVMNFKVSSFPKRTAVGNKCYLCYKGNIIG